MSPHFKAGLYNRVQNKNISIYNLSVLFMQDSYNYCYTRSLAVSLKVLWNFPSGLVSIARIHQIKVI